MTIRMSKHLKRRLEWAKRQRPDLSERKVIEMALRKWRRLSCADRVAIDVPAASGAIVVNVELDPELVGDATAGEIRAILDWYLTPYEVGSLTIVVGILALGMVILEAALEAERIASDAAEIKELERELEELEDNHD